MTGYFWYFPLGKKIAHIGAGDYKKQHVEETDKLNKKLNEYVVVHSDMKKYISKLNSSVAKLKSNAIESAKEKRILQKHLLNLLDLFIKKMTCAHLISARLTQS